MAYQKLQPERAYLIPQNVNFDIVKDNPFQNIKQVLNQVTDFTITTSSGAIDTITIVSTKPIYGYMLSKLPVVTIATVTGGGTGETATTALDANGKLVINSNAVGTGYSGTSVIKITLSDYKIIPSARLQPFTAYTNDATSIDSVYSAAGDSIGTISCTAGVMLPFQFSSLTPSSTKGIIALW